MNAMGRAAVESAGGRLTLDLDALAANWRDLARRAAPSATAGVVKGDGYGIGLEAATAVIARAGCTTFFTATLEEAVRAKGIAPAAEVLVLNGLPPGCAERVAAAGLVPVLSTIEEVEEWSAFGRTSGRRWPAALQVNSGMNRLGTDPAETQAIAASAEIAATVEWRLLMSHLASADDPGNPQNLRQRTAFEAARALFPGLRASLANSAATLALPAFHYDLVRPGIAVYGGAALAHGPNPMRPVAHLEGRVVQLRAVAAGEPVGYGAAAHPARDSRVAIVGLGYADGFPRSAGSADARPGGFGWYRGRRVPLLGRVSMDLVAYDVTEVPVGEIGRGSWIEIFGANVAVDEVAAAAGTIGYELLTHLGRRYARRTSGAAG